VRIVLGAVKSGKQWQPKRRALDSVIKVQPFVHALTMIDFLPITNHFSMHI